MDAPALLADLVVVLHLGFLAFVGVGAVLLPRHPRLAWLHAPALAWAVVSLTVGLECPLTNLEKALRPDPYETGFVDHYLEGVLVPPSLTPLLWASAAAVTLAAYARLTGARRRNTTT